MFVLATRLMTVTFSEALESNSSLQALSWKICDATNQRPFIAALDASGTQVTGTTTMDVGAACSGGSCTYNALISDVKGSTGVPVEAFVKFPMTII
jgi:hypothetical protein